MAQTIWKFELGEVCNRLMLPRGAHLLTVAEQYGKVMAWARVDDAQPKEPREVFLVGTGTPVPKEAGRHLGTAMCAHGTLVFHAFEREVTGGSPDSITCPRCRRTSYNPNDIRERYCGACHQYHDAMTGPPS